MSRATLLKVYKTKAHWELELHNASRGAHVLWEYLYWSHFASQEDRDNKYFYLSEENSLVLDNLLKPLNEGTWPLHHRVAFSFTCDRAVISPEHIKLVVPLFRKLAHEMTGYTIPKGWPSHWPDIADWIEKVSQEKLDPRMLGIALNPTSVADVWDEYPKLLRDKTPILFETNKLWPDLAEKISLEKSV